MLDLGPWNYPWDDLMIGAAGHVTLIVVGYAASLLFAGPGDAESEYQRMTLWDWLKRRRASRAEAAKVG
jgi:hypothetical protein